MNQELHIRYTQKWIHEHNTDAVGKVLVPTI